MAQCQACRDSGFPGMVLTEVGWPRFRGDDYTDRWSPCPECGLREAAPAAQQADVPICPRCQTPVYSVWHVTECSREVPRQQPAADPLPATTARSRT